MVACSLDHRLQECRFIALDLDGTSLDATGHFSRRTASALQRAPDIGLHTAIISARPLGECRALISPLEADCWVGASNGAVAGKGDSDALLWSHEFSATTAARLVERVHQSSTDVALGAVAHDRVLVERGFPSRLSGQWGADTVSDMATALDLGVHKFLVTHAAGVEEAERAVVRAVRDLESEVASTRSTDDFVEISLRHVSKGTALRAFARLLDIDLNSCAAIGDMPNDLSMLASAGIPLAVANAHPDVLLAASHVLPSNEEDGVALALEAAIANIVRGLGHPTRST